MNTNSDATKDVGTPFVASAGSPPAGWKYADEATNDGFNKWGAHSYLVAFMKTEGGDGKPTYDLSILWDEKQKHYIPAHGVVIMSERAPTAAMAAEIAMTWYEAETGMSGSAKKAPMASPRGVKVEDLIPRDRVDLTSCPYLKDHPSAGMEYAVVVHTERETPGAVVIGYEGIDHVGYPVGTVLMVSDENEVLQTVALLNELTEYASNGTLEGDDEPDFIAQAETFITRQQDVLQATDVGEAARLLSEAADYATNATMEGDVLPSYVVDAQTMAKRLASRATLPFMTAVAGHVLIHDGDTGATLSDVWTGICNDARDAKKFWYIGRSFGERSFNALQATDLDAAKREIVPLQAREATELPPSPGEIGHALDWVYANYEFGNGVDVEDSSGWEYTEPGTEWTRTVYVRLDEGEHAGASTSIKLVAKLQPGRAVVQEAYAIDSNGQIWGSLPATMSVVAVAPVETSPEVSQLRVKQVATHTSEPTI